MYVVYQFPLVYGLSYAGYKILSMQFVVKVKTLWAVFSFLINDAIFKCNVKFESENCTR